MAASLDEDNGGNNRPPERQVELYWGTMNLVLGSLAGARPEWLHTIALPAWYPRYAGLQARETMPQTPEQRQALTRALRADILYLLNMVDQSSDAGLKSLPEVQALRRAKEELTCDDL